MRAYIVVLALLATPLAIGVSQTPDLPGNSSCDNGNGTATRSDSGTANAHQGLCVPQPPPPPPPPTCGQTPAATGTASIQGQVFQDVSPDFPPLPGWCVDLSGPVSGSAVSDVGGFYSFTGLPAGVYTICEEVQPGWHETFPSNPVAACPSGLGYSFFVGDGAVAQMNDFGNVTP
jgi:hypothetical protein